MRRWSNDGPHDISSPSVVTAETVSAFILHQYVLGATIFGMVVNDELRPRR